MADKDDATITINKSTQIVCKDLLMWLLTVKEHKTVLDDTTKAVLKNVVKVINNRLDNDIVSVDKDI